MSKQPRIPEWMILGGDGKVRLEHFDSCARGHPIAQVGMGPCPDCKVLTMRWYCADLRCDGILVSTAHRQVCAPRG
jgi:hypothetical protein